jgi:metal-sulfur cluster biosynthetic enzyme
MNLKEKVIAALKKVYDPEMPVNIYELGLIYDARWMMPDRWPSA